MEKYGDRECSETRRVAHRRLGLPESCRLQFEKRPSVPCVMKRPMLMSTTQSRGFERKFMRLSEFIDSLQSENAQRETAGFDGDAIGFQSAHSDPLRNLGKNSRAAQSNGQMAKKKTTGQHCRLRFDSRIAVAAVTASRSVRAIA